MSRNAPTTLSRRATLSAIAGVVALPLIGSEARATGTERRRAFTIRRGNSEIGEHRVSVRTVGARVIAATEIDIAVRILGLTAYRYTLAYTEEYGDDGKLLRLDGQCNDNGERDFVRAVRSDGGIEIDGSGHSGLADGGAMPTSYWRRNALQRPTWISTQSGKLLDVRISPSAVPEAPAGAQAYRATDGRDFAVDLFFDERREWIGSAFDARGERAVYVLKDDTGVLNI